MKDRIKKIRRDLGLTQQELANRIGIKRGAIANYEIGRNTPTDSVVSLICREFGISEEWLRYGTGEMFAPDVDDELEALVKRYDLSNADKVLIERYMSLKADSRETIINFITDAAASLKEEKERQDLHDDLDREIDNQKKVEEKSIGSDSTSA